MKYFEKIADVKEWMEEKAEEISKLDNPKVKLVQGIVKEKWKKDWKQLKKFLANKYNTLKNAITGD
jgi:hypothetical protein